MYTVKTEGEILREIREIDPCLQNIRLSNIEIDRSKKEINYLFICDKTVSEDLKNAIWERVEKITAPIFSHIAVTVKKITTNDELVDNEIYKYLSANHPSMSIFLKPTDIRCAVVGDVVKYTIKMTKDGVEYFTKSGVLAKLNDFLSTKFCSDFAGNLEVKEVEETISLISEEVYESELQKIEHRTIKVVDVVVVDDYTIGDTAIYIEDVTSGDAVVCGKVTEITEKQTKNGKPFFVIHIDDTTGQLGGVYFTKKNTYTKIKDITVGESIIARGTLGEYNGKQSFTFSKINRCTFPQNFVKKDKYKKSAPKNYQLIKPKKASTIKISNIFDVEEPLPSELTSKVYVVFDLETTGLDVTTNGITEIGAVKLVNGKVVEEFSSLIKPDYPITDKIVELTGITEEMVKNAPRINQVLPDFMKFISGAVLVAHNADFDTKFIKKFASAEDYEINNEVLDSMHLSREVFPSFRHVDLHTMADHFGITFHHHRALSDSYATAELLIELMKLKYNAK